MYGNATWLVVARLSPPLANSQSVAAPAHTEMRPPYSWLRLFASCSKLYSSWPKLHSPKMLAGRHTAICT